MLYRVHLDAFVTILRHHEVAPEAFFGARLAEENSRTGHTMGFMALDESAHESLALSLFRFIRRLA